MNHINRMAQSCILLFKIRQIRRLGFCRDIQVFIRNDIQLYGYNGANHLLANNHEINENTAQTSCELAEQAKGRCIYYNALRKA